MQCLLARHQCHWHRLRLASRQSSRMGGYVPGSPATSFPRRGAAVDFHATRFHGFRRLFNLGFKTRVRCVSCNLIRSYFGEFRSWAPSCQAPPPSPRAPPRNRSTCLATKQIGMRRRKDYRAMGHAHAPQPIGRSFWASVGTYVKQALLLVLFVRPPSTSDPGWRSYLRCRGSWMTSRAADDGGRPPQNSPLPP